MLEACHSHTTFSCQGFWKPLITMHVLCCLFLDLSNKSIGRAAFAECDDNDPSIYEKFILDTI